MKDGRYLVIGNLSDVSNTRTLDSLLLTWEVLAIGSYRLLIANSQITEYLYLSPLFTTAFKIRIHITFSICSCQNKNINFGIYFFLIQSIYILEVVVRRYSLKQVFLKILQISQKSTCVGVSFYLLSFKKRPKQRCFPVKLAKFLQHFCNNFFTKHLGGCF